MNGSYSTAANKRKPAISLTYDVKDFDVQQTFFAFNTVQKLMPIGKYLAGKLNSQLTLNGSLGDDMMPDLNSLNGNGSFFLIEGFLSKFKPLEKLGEKINVTHLQELSLREVKNYIEFSNGKVTVKPFKLKIKGIDMEIGGIHGFDQSLAYLIDIRLPRSMLGNKKDSIVENIVSQVNAKGVPVKINDQAHIFVQLGGFINNPIIKIDLKQAATSLAEEFRRQAKEALVAKIDSTKAFVKNKVSRVTDTFRTIKKDLVETAREKFKKPIFGTKDIVSVDSSKTTERKAFQPGKEILDIFKRKKKQPDSAANNQ